MAKYMKYEKAKAELTRMGLSSEEYTRRLRQIAKRLGI